MNAKLQRKLVQKNRTYIQQPNEIQISLVRPRLFMKMWPTEMAELHTLFITRQGKTHKI